MQTRIESWRDFLAGNGLATSAGLHIDLWDWLADRGIDMGGHPLAPFVRWISDVIPIPPEEIGPAVHVLATLLAENEEK